MDKKPQPGFFISSGQKKSARRKPFQYKGKMDFHSRCSGLASPLLKPHKPIRSWLDEHINKLPK
ncbi:MAG TPA: hypothetical protein VGI63_09085 [Verrucomicrobiae bacterium]|jgi:hypothetical protein